MATNLPVTNGHTNGDHTTNGDSSSNNTFSVKAGLARMLKGGVIMDVVNAEQVRLIAAHYWSIVESLTSHVGTYS